MNEPVITRLKSADLEAVTPLITAQLREHGIASSPADLLAVMRSVLARPEQGFLLLASCADAPVGVAYAAGILSLEHGGPSGWLEELYVMPEWRDRGLGSLLLEKVLTTAAQLGWRALDLEVDAAHERVMALYARFHFKPVSRTRFVRRLQFE